MIPPVLLYGALATHRRGRVLQEALSAAPTTALPEAAAVLIGFADAFQAADAEEQSRLIAWTRAPGHLLILIPPFAMTACEQPVSWRVERLGSPPRGGEGIATALATEVGYRLTGSLQTPSIPGATWSDLSVCTGVHRQHPASGLFAVTCLPLWSLAVLDAASDLEVWLGQLAGLAGEHRAAEVAEPEPLQPDHYGLLVFLLSREFDSEEQAFAALRSSAIFRFSAETGAALLRDLRTRGLVMGAVPTAEAQALVMQSPYAPYVSALREASR